MQNALYIPPIIIVIACLGYFIFIDRTEHRTLGGLAKEICSKLYISAIALALVLYVIIILISGDHEQALKIGGMFAILMIPIEYVFHITTGNNAISEAYRPYAFLIYSLRLFLVMGPIVLAAG